MSAAPLTVIELAPMIRAADALMRDKSYRNSPVGHECARYLRRLRWSGNPETTRDSYETTYAHLALDHADYEGLAGFCNPTGTAYLERFLERHWADASQNTKRQRTSALRSLFAWAADDGLIPWNPAAKLKLPRRTRGQRHAYPAVFLYKLVSAQPALRDQCALQLLCRLGIRKNELRVLRVGEIDLHRNLITLHRKGGKVEVLPLGPPSMREDLYLYLQAEGRQDNEYLLYPRGHRQRPMDQASVHRWFKRCLERAGLPTGVQMHEMRHSAADAVRLVKGDVTMAQLLLSHENLATTQDYLHPTSRELADTLAMLDEEWGK